ncbi:hypothetical protein H0H93_008142 [Arthromyces matolae]|nr:hypothetical protein H0H93_008142 [Arthromyces matolae]
MNNLSVTSPPSASPINPSPVSPYQFQFEPPYDDFDNNRRTPGPSRTSTSTPSSSLPPPQRKRTTPVIEENILYDDSSDAQMDLASSQSYDDIDMRYTPNSASATTANGSPVDPSDPNSGGEADSGITMGTISGIGGTMNILGKPMATNNFVTKLYQMINDPKSAHYIAWTELGTSFVVSNVGEFSRSILGSHFKHNNTPRAQRTSTDAQTWEFSHHKFLRGRPDLLDEIKRKALEPDPSIKHRVELPGEVAAQLNAMRDENRRVWDQLNQERKRADRLAATLQRLWEVVGSRIGGLSTFPTDLLDINPDSPNIFITSPGVGGPSNTGAGNGSGPSASSANVANSNSNTSGTGGRFPPLSINMNNVHIGNHNHGHSGLHTLHSPNSSSPTQSQSDFMDGQGGQATPGQGQGQGAGAGQSAPNGQGPVPPSLSRQHSFQHVSSYLRNATVNGDSSSSLPGAPGSPGGGSSSMDLYDDNSVSVSGVSENSSSSNPQQQQHPQTPQLQPQARISSKRPRISTDDDLHPLPLLHGHAGHGSAPSSAHPDATSALSSPGVGVNLGGVGLGLGGGVGRKASRARSDSAPLGYGFGGHGGLSNGAGQQHHHSSPTMNIGMGGLSPTPWGVNNGHGGHHGGRPRSGSGLAPLGLAGRGLQAQAPSMMSIPSVGHLVGGGGIGGRGMGGMNMGMGVGIAGQGQGQQGQGQVCQSKEPAVPPLHPDPDAMMETDPTSTLAPTLLDLSTSTFIHAATPRFGIVLGLVPSPHFFPRVPPLLLAAFFSYLTSLSVCLLRTTYSLLL